MPATEVILITRPDRRLAFQRHPVSLKPLNPTFQALIIPQPERHFRHVAYGLSAQQLSRV
jgi:hypothetical protein